MIDDLDNDIFDLHRKRFEESYRESAKEGLSEPILCTEENDCNYKPKSSKYISHQELDYFKYSLWFEDVLTWCEDTREFIGTSFRTPGIMECIVKYSIYLMLLGILVPVTLCIFGAMIMMEYIVKKFM